MQEEGGLLEPLPPYVHYSPLLATLLPRDEAANSHGEEEFLWWSSCP